MAHRFVRAETEDQHSDVDTLLVVADPRFDDVLASWPDIARQLTPVVYLKRLGQAPVFNVVLPGWLRWDVTLARSDEPPYLVRGRVRRVFDKDDTPMPDPVPGGINQAAALGLTCCPIRTTRRCEGCPRSPPTSAQACGSIAR